MRTPPWLHVAEEVKKSHESGRVPSFGEHVDRWNFGKGIGQLALHQPEHYARAMAEMLGIRAALHWGIRQVGASPELNEEIERLWNKGKPVYEETVFARFSKNYGHYSVQEGKQYLKDLFARHKSAGKFEDFAWLMTCLRISARDELLFHIKNPVSLRRIHRNAPKKSFYAFGKKITYALSKHPYVTAIDGTFIGSTGEVFVSGHIRQEEFQRAIAVHEKFEQITGSHEKAEEKAVEYARKKGFLKEYLRWAGARRRVKQRIREKLRLNL